MFKKKEVIYTLFLPLDILMWEQYLLSMQLLHPAYVVVCVVQPGYNYEGTAKKNHRELDAWQY